MNNILRLWILALVPVSFAAVAKPACYDNERYHVIAQDLEDSTGQRIAMLKRAPGDPPPACTVAQAKSLPALAVPEDSYAIGLKQHFLLIDQGTGPDGRQLVLWNLQQGHVVWHSAYADLLRDGSPDTLTFWRPEDRAPDEAHCPKLRQWRKESLGAAMEQQVQLRLADLKVTTLGRWRCEARQ